MDRLKGKIALVVGAGSIGPGWGNGKATAFTSDVSRAGDVEAMVAACLKTYGRIDVLDNNVGIAETGNVVEVSEADWDRVFAAKHIRVNAILPGLMKTPMVEHSAGLAASYAAGNVEEMWRARDAQVPMGHMGEAWDVANAALFLASDESKYITGIELVVDGGLTCRA